jgi:RNA polymerase sigma-70 factor (ECF subfamily)
MCLGGVPIVVEVDTADKSAENNSFALWYAKEYQKLLRTLIVTIGDADVAADATSEAFARALQRWERVRGMSSPTGWTYTVALNVARRLFRRRRVEAIVLHRQITLPPIRDDSLEIWDAVQRLPMRQRTAIALHYLSDLPQRDVATAMGIAEGTVAATLSQARRQLAVALSHSVGEEDLRNG